MRIGHINLAKGFRGGERQTQLLIQSLSKTDIQQTLIARKQSSLIERLDGIPILVNAIQRPFLLHRGHARDCDLLHAHEAKAAHFAYLAHKKYGMPYIITRRVPNLPKNNRFTHNMYRNASRIVAISRAVREIMLNYDPALRLSIIPSMCSRLNHSDEMVKKLRQEFPDKFLIGHIGALVDHHKGQATIIEAARGLSKSHPHFHFILVGDGKDQNRLKSMAAGLNNITFTGFKDNIGDYLALFDLFVFPSREEGLGSILLDAMQFNLPIVASRVDGIVDLVEHEKTGLLIEVNHAIQLADAIIRLYKHVDLRDKLVEQAARFVENYEPDLLARKYCDLYSEILRHGH